MLRSNWCDFSDAYSVVKGIVTVSADERDMTKCRRLRHYQLFYFQSNLLLLLHFSKLFFFNICFFVELLQGLIN